MSRLKDRDIIISPRPGISLEAQVLTITAGIESAEWFTFFRFSIKEWRNDIFRGNYNICHK